MQTMDSQHCHLNHSQTPSESQSQLQSQSKAQSQPQKPQPLQLFSPTLTDNSLAVLSPPSSRYAFEPSITTSAIPPINSILSSPTMNGNRVTSPIPSFNGSNINNLNNLNNINNINCTSMENQLSSIGYGNENDVPAFEPKTEINLQNFTNDLKMFNNWIQNLNNEEQKTVMNCFLENLSSDVIDYMKSKLNNYNDKNLLFSPSNNNMNLNLNSTSSASTAIKNQNLRPVSPILSLNSTEPTTLDSILNQPEMYLPTPKKILSPQVMKTGFSNLTEPIIRPRSAGPSIYGEFQSSFNGNMNNMANHNLNPNNQTNFMSYQNQPLTSQPLIKVVSEDLNHNLSNFAGQNIIKLNHSLNTITNRSKMDSNKSMKDDRGRQNFLQNKNSLEFNNQQSLSVPPNNRIRNSNTANNMNLNSSSNGHVSGNGNNNNNIMNTVINTNHHHHTLSADSDYNSDGAKKSVNSMPKDIASITLLNNIPAWLKTLRLHKYTENLRNINWKDMIELNDSQLSELGVSTVGARNKLLKSFTFVKENLHE